jgi:hypothetical protein
LRTNNIFAGPIARILVELGQWLWEKSPGGKLPVEVYKILDRIQEMIGIAEGEMEDARQNLPLNTDGTIIESPNQEEVNTGGTTNTGRN